MVDSSKTYQRPIKTPAYSFEMFTFIINSPGTGLRKEGSCSTSRQVEASVVPRFHVWHVLPVTVGIPLLPTTGGFPSPAFPPPSSVTRARGREKHNYRTEEIITQRLPHVTDHRKRPLHRPVTLMPAISCTGQHLTRSHQLLQLDQLFDLIK